MKNGMGWACALLVWLWAALAAAAPEISGVSWNGDGTVTITGAGFGPGPLSALLVFDRFDDEQPGATLDNAASEYGAWTTQLRSPRAASPCVCPAAGCPTSALRSRGPRFPASSGRISIQMTDAAIRLMG